MTEQHLTIEAFHEQLQQWNGDKILISKQELEDEDATIMELENVTCQTTTRRLDDYQPMHTLQLNGTGKIENETQDLQPLPSSIYEIPLEDSSHYQFDGSRFVLTTDRGKYTIEKV